MPKTDLSETLFRKAREFLPGGVNSPVRACAAVGVPPLIIKNGKGARIWDADDNEYIDYVCSWGPLILGHAHPEVVASVCEAAAHGTSFGATCKAEIDLARMICEAIPSIDKVRMVSSGTEATMSAVRLARAYTGRDTIVKFAGCYHGHGDSFLIKAGSGMLTAGIPAGPGVPESVARHTLTAGYNSLESVESLFNEQGGNIAAVIVEPIAGNMGLVPPREGFLEGLRRLTQQHGALLIFDEVITGFRLCYGGYQSLAGITPDLTTLGKVIGGGLPVGAYGGRADIMQMVAPAGAVYQAGTLSGNPLAMAAGSATLRILATPGCYEVLERAGAALASYLEPFIRARGYPCRLHRTGSLFSVFFSGNTVTDYESALQCDTGRFALFYRELLNSGVYFPPSQFETCFISCAHDEEDLEKTARAIQLALERVHV